MSNPIAECYEFVTTEWGEDAWYYTRPQGHSGIDYDAIAGQAVFSYSEFEVTTIEWNSGIGWCIEGRETKTGDYVGWAHIRGAVVRVGQIVPAGVPFCEVAGSNDKPGSTWFGPHIHTTRSKQARGLFYGPTYDPKPYINAAKAAWAAGEVKPIPKEPKMTIQDLHTQYSRKNGQTVKAKAVDHVYVEDAPKNYVAVVAGPHQAVNGDVKMTVVGPAGHTFMVVPFLRTWKNGKLVSEQSLGGVEFTTTPGETPIQVGVHLALQAGDRLSFKIGGSDVDLKVTRVVFRGNALDEKR